MPCILLLEDDDDIAFGIQAFLQQKGCAVLCCPDIAAARTRFGPAVDLVLLDLNLPDGSGYDYCRAVKSVRDIPVIFLTVRDEEGDIVRGLDMGADDYIVKPFQLSVLYSRINAVLRRSAPVQGENLACGDILLDAAAARAFRGGCEVLLTAGEFRLLKILLENRSQTLTRKQLLDRLWDSEGNFVNDNTLTVTMKRLREKLGHPSCIKTLRGIGYRMEEEL